jgi:hypothetical protein
VVYRPWGYVAGLEMIVTSQMRMHEPIVGLAPKQVRRRKAALFISPSSADLHVFMQVQSFQCHFVRHLQASMILAMSMPQQRRPNQRVATNVGFAMER